MPTPDVYAVDLHSHSRFFHGFGPRPTSYDPVGAWLLGAVASRRGLDAVALTNHDYAYDRDGASVSFLPGVEVSTTMGHLLVVGPDPPERTNPEALTPAEVVELARERDCATIVAHPYRNSTVMDSSAEFDAVELNGKTAETHEAARSVAESRELPLVGGSDAHYPVEVGRAFTLVDATELTPSAVVEAIRDGRVEPVLRPDALHRALDSVYQVVHRVKHRASGG